MNIIIWGIGTVRVDIRGTDMATPSPTLLASIIIVPDFWGGTRFSKMIIHAENRPQPAADRKKFAKYMWSPEKGNPITMS